MDGCGQRTSSLDGLWESGGAGTGRERLGGCTA